MGSNKETITLTYNANTGDYVSDVSKAESANKQFDASTDQAEGGLKGLNNALLEGVKSYGAIGLAAIGAVKSFNESTNAILTNQLNVAKWQSEIDATPETIAKVNQANKELANSYVLPQAELNRISALNAAYISDADDLIKANKLVAQTAILYALKEGDLSLATDQAVTSQEALRDVIITGSTTAFEDSAISLDEYGNQLLKVTGFTDDQVKSITEGTNGTFEYVEQLSKAASPQQRFTALAAATNTQMEDLAGSLSTGAQQTLAFKRALNEVQSAFKQVVAFIVIGIASIGAWIAGIVDAISQSEAWAKVTEVAGNVFQKLSDVFQEIAPYIDLVVRLIGQFLTPIIDALAPFIEIVVEDLKKLIKASVELYKAIAPFVIPIIVKLGLVIQQLIIAIAPVLEAIGGLVGALIDFLVPAFKAVYDIIFPLIDIFISLLGPIIVAIAKIFAFVLTGAINVTTTAFELLTPVMQVLEGVVRVLAYAVEVVLTLAFLALKKAAEPFVQLFEDLSGKTETLKNKAGELASSLENTLKGALDAIKTPIEQLIGFFDTLKNSIDLAKNAISDFANIAIDAFNSIPFIPDIPTGRSGFAIRGVGTGGVQNNNTSKQVIFNVQQTGSLTKLDVLRMERGLTT